MSRIVWLFAVIALLAGAPAAAAAPEQAAASLEPRVTVLLFVEGAVRQYEENMKLILDGVKDKFKQAEIIIHDDNKRKSPEYMDLIENVKTDPVNEQHIRSVSLQHIAKFARDINSRYIAVVNLSSWKTNTTALQLHLTVASAGALR